MVEIVTNNEEIIRNSVNLIWEATQGQVVTITFNSQLYLVTISLDNSTNITINLEAPRAIIIREKFLEKYINDNTKDNQGIDKLINVVSGMFKQQAGNIENANIPSNKYTTNIQHESLSDSDNDSPGWSECDKCYRLKKEFCKICSCSICKWKGVRGHILLCDGYCSKNFHT
ncbi:6922_t:CDS:2, partial [Racocetra persica]